MLEVAFRDCLVELKWLSAKHLERLADGAAVETVVKSAHLLSWSAVEIGALNFDHFAQL